MKCPRTGVPAAFCSCSLHQRIGGQLTSQAYAQLAANTKHRPTYRDDVARAIRDLAAQGLKAHDIANILGIGVDAVSALLESPPTQPGAARGDEAAELHRDAWAGRGER